jgi:osmoprotectant transport system permease protein
MHRTDAPSRRQVLVELEEWLNAAHKIRLLGPLGFENAYALAMTRKKAQAFGIRTIADLANHARELSIAGDYEFFARPEWNELRKTYGLQFKSQRQMQPEFMYKAVAGGEVDVISAYTSDGQIIANDLVVLEDVRQAIPPYDAVLLLSPRRGHDEKLIDALKPLIGGISVELMREANAQATDGGTTPDRVARWLSDQVEKRR